MRLAAAVALVAAAVAVAERAPAARESCTPRASAAYARGVERALRAKRDVWGEKLLASAQGPTEAGVRRYLRPLLYAGAAKKRPLTESGVHYVTFTQPGAGVALHVADGSQIVWRRIGGRTLTVRAGGERYGACAGRLSTPRLADGWLPILQTRYGAYGQESFAARVGGRFESYVRVTGPAVRIGTRSFRGVGLAAWNGSRLRTVTEAEYAAARASLADYWERRLREGIAFDVPETRVMDAQRNLLVQNLGMTWRYSIGNAYEQFSFPESPDNAEVLAAYGHEPTARAILRTSFTRKNDRYPSWKTGDRLLAIARYRELTGDRAFAAAQARGYVNVLARRIGSNGLLPRERFSSDISDQVYGLHAQAVAWQGLRAVGANGPAARLERGLRRAVALSVRRLPDGSLFVPMRLLDGERPYDALMTSREGSYWNLVAPYAFASGFLTPAQERGAWRYMQRHGSRLLGLVRAVGFALYAEPRYPTSGTDQVYGLAASRFLARLGEWDQLVLTLYGHLGAGMTPGTFVAGEAASVEPLGGRALRSMYLPPSSATNSAFLETLRLMLVHETATGLELAHGTPRTWLRPGARIQVSQAPTRFGPLSYSLVADASTVRGTLTVPSRTAPRAVKLRVRLPRGQRITSVTLDGQRFMRLNRSTGTIDLSGRRGTIELEIAYARR